LTLSINLSNGQRSSDQAEQQIIRKITQGDFPAGEELPPERQLAILLGIGRPALREALQRLERDGWITQRQGRPALVNNYWEKGNMYTLVNLVQTVDKLPEEFIAYLLELRSVLAPVYMRQAVQKTPAKVVALLADWESLPDQNEAYAEFDWMIHKKTAMLSGNPLYVFLLNSFDPVYIPLAAYYFQWPKHREVSYLFYQRFLQAAMKSDGDQAEQIVKEAMLESISLWKEKEGLEIVEPNDKDK
jgi:GntR family negative regulator for fad regulon and positive regulator of fabA